MTSQKHYLDNGWGALNGALIFCPSQELLPITRDQLIEASRTRWPDRNDPGASDNPNTKQPPGVSIDVHPENQYPFVLDLHNGGLLISMDGLPEQNVETAAWIRSLMPEDAPRMVVGDGGFSTHAELPFGVTPEQIASTMVDHGVEGWNDDDPDLQW